MPCPTGTFTAVAAPHPARQTSVLSQKSAEHREGRCARSARRDDAVI